MSPRVQPLSRWEVPLPTMAGKGVSFLWGWVFTAIFDFHYLAVRRQPALFVISPHREDGAEKGDDRPDDIHDGHVLPMVNQLLVILPAPNVFSCFAGALVL